MSITPVDAKFFQSSNGGMPPYCTFFAIAPEGSRLEHVFRPEFWAKVVATQACNGRLHLDDIIRIRSEDRTFDLFVVVSGFRKDASPLLVRFPTDPMAMVKADVKLPNFIPRTLVEACQVLGIELNADEDVIKKVGDALRVASHPDLARDEPDRQWREARFKQVGAALELLSGKRKAA
jgi:hypothetical protein